MAQFENIYDIDLSLRRKDSKSLLQPIGEGDANGLRVGARVFNGGESVSLGGQCVGKVIRADGETVPLMGTISGNEASVVLDQQSCAVEGPIQVAVMWVSGTNITTLVIAYGTVVNTTSGNVIQPSTPLPDLTQLLAEIDAMRTATAAANAAAEKSVRYDTAQSLSTAQKTTARANIGAAADADVDDLKSAFEQFSAYDIFPAFCVYNNKIVGEVSYTWNAEKTTCTVNGTSASGTNYDVMYTNQNVIPEPLTVGGTYYVNVKTTNSNLYLRVYKYYTDGTNETFSYHENGELTIPDNMKGLIVRVQLANGATAVNDTITVSLTSVKTNEWLDKELSQISEDVVENAIWQGLISESEYASCDDIWRSGLYFKSDSSETTGYPFETGYLFVGSSTNRQNATGILQIAFSYKDEYAPMYKKRINGNWTDWAFFNKDLSEAIEKIKTTLFKYNSYDMVPLGNGESGTSSGISYTKNADGTWTIDGTIQSGFSILNILQYRSGLPEFIVPGRTYTVHYNGPSTVKIEAFFYNAEGHTSAYVSDGEEIAIPEDLTGLIVRFRVNSPATISSETVTISIVAKVEQTVINQEIHNDTFNNTYNITTTPQISTDSNGWLSPVDTETQDETGKTDMTGPIMAMLTSTGYCHLAPGVYYVSGNIDMPEGSMLEGCGKTTVIRLLQSVTEGYVVKMEKYNTISNLRISGSYTDLSTAEFTSDKGTRHGIIFNSRYAEGTRQTEHCTAQNIYLDNFTGCGIKCYNASIRTERGMYASQIKIAQCQTGVFVDFYSEFNKFELVNTRNCYIACENDGGNNMFIGCTFTATNTAFLIDNSLGDKTNNAHGSVVGCTFCHTGNNQGIAIAVKNIVNGFTFADCQVWYCSILVEDSYGVAFTGMEFGRGTTGGGATIRINRGGAVIFTGCIFMNDVKYTPDIVVTDNDKVRFTGCYGSHSGNAITAQT